MRIICQSLKILSREEGYNGQQIVVIRSRNPQRYNGQKIVVIRSSNLQRYNGQKIVVIRSRNPQRYNGQKIVVIRSRNQQRYNGRKIVVIRSRNQSGFLRIQVGSLTIMNILYPNIHQNFVFQSSDIYKLFYNFTEILILKTILVFLKLMQLF